MAPDLCTEEPFENRGDSETIGRSMERIDSFTAELVLLPPLNGGGHGLKD